jgi:hypothetical protein
METTELRPTPSGEDSLSRRRRFDSSILREYYSPTLVIPNVDPRVPEILLERSSTKGSGSVADSIENHDVPVNPHLLIRVVDLVELQSPGPHRFAVLRSSTYGAIAADFVEIRSIELLNCLPIAAELRLLALELEVKNLTTDCLRRERGMGAGNRSKRSNQRERLRDKPVRPVRHARCAATARGD